MRSCRTLCRLFVSRRHLLEWITAAQATSSPRLDCRGFYRQMAGGVVIGVAGGAVRLACRPRGAGRSPRRSSLALAALAGDRALGQPVAADAGSLRDLRRRRASAAADRAAHLALLRDLRDAGRQHAAAGQLPGGPEAGRRAPDVADQHRPLSAVGRRARAISAGSARSRPSSGSRRRSRPWSSWQRFRGHFYNWYDTRDLRPLDPRYVSSVDSGNLAGHLIALANACAAWRDRRRRAAQRCRRRRATRSRSRARRCGALPDDRRTQLVTPRSSWTTRSTRSRAALAASLPAIGCDDARALHAGDGRRHRASARQRTRRRRRAPTCCSGSRPRSASIDSHRRDVAQRPTSRRSAAAPAATHRGDGARAWPTAMEFGFLLDPERQLLSIGYRVADGQRSTRAATTCSPPRRGWRASSRSPRATCRRATGSGSAARSTPVGTRRGADLLVGLDVRVPDAVAGHARAARQPARADQPADRAAADRLRRASSACRGASPNRPTTPATSSSPTSTRTSACPASASSAASARTPSSRPTRRRSPPWSTRAAALRNFARLAGDRRARPLRLLRGARLHAVARCRKAQTSAIVRAYMAHHQGMTHRRHRQRAARRRDARALPRRADRPGDRAAAAGAHAARCRGRPSAGRGGRARPRRVDDLEPADAAPSAQPARRQRRRRTCCRTAATR